MVQDGGAQKAGGGVSGVGDGKMLTPSMARFTRSFLMRPELYRFSMSSVLVEPEQNQAIEMALLASIRFKPTIKTSKGGELGAMLAA